MGLKEANKEGRSTLGPVAVGPCCHTNPDGTREELGGDPRKSRGSWRLCVALTGRGPALPTHGQAERKLGVIPRLSPPIWQPPAGTSH